MSRARAIGLKLDAPAGRLLAELIGPDPFMLASELDKLLAYSAGDVVREADVREMVSRAKEHKGWELSDAVIEGQGAKAARVLHELVEDGQPMPLILATIAGRYRRIAIARDMMERGEPAAAIARQVNVKAGFGLTKLMEQVERLSWDDLRDAYARIIKAELDVKQDSMDERLALELVVQELASGPVGAGNVR
jgi:DNA polymerase-3 subunit delta